MLRRHLQAGRQAPAVHFLLGEVLLQQYRFADAETALRHAVLGRSDRPLWLHRLAISLAQQGQCRAALPFLEQALKLQPTPQRLFDRAQCRLAGGHFADAESDFKAVVEASPEHSRAWLELGILAHNRGDDTQALGHFQQALTADEHNVEARYQLGLAALAAGQHAQAVEFLQHVRVRVPGHIGATYNLAHALRATGDSAASRQILLEFRQLSAQDDLLDNHLQALQHQPTDVPTRLDTSRLLLNMGRVTEAIEHLEVARRLDPSQHQTHVLLSQAYALIGRSDDADAALRAAKRLALDGEVLDSEGSEGSEIHP